MIPTIIGIVVVILIICAIAGIYNNMVTLRNRIDNAWQNIDTQLQRRNDLIPNLVETVKRRSRPSPTRATPPCPQPRPRTRWPPTPC